MLKSLVLDLLEVYIQAITKFNIYPFVKLRSFVISVIQMQIT